MQYYDTTFSINIRLCGNLVLVITSLHSIYWSCWCETPVGLVEEVEVNKTASR
ncbi:hypothetical protein [Jeotgalibacillus sp. S-D1]|uniref:hypothetical protein n=1 Tax=Jeotgalibacillus sp. S-D1 TaxID=2552189 RepID=UPI0014050486|nr:hypothetical protein [Jeotgalibacillus sp. S-D1]